MKKLSLVLLSIILIMVIGCNPDDEILQKRVQNMDEISDDPKELYTDDILNKELDPFGGKEICGEVIEKSLLSHGNFIGGSLFIANTEDKLFFKFIPVEGWLISEVNLHIGGLDDIPASQSGNPQYSEFLNTYIYNPPLPEVSVPFDLLDIEIRDDGNITIVAHAKIIEIEDDGLEPRIKSVIAEWDDDLLFLGPRRGGGFIYEIQSCEEDPYATAGEGETTDPDADLLVDPLCVDPAQLPLINRKSDPEQAETLGIVDFFTVAENMIFSFSVDPDWKISSIHINAGDFDDDQYNGGGNVPPGRYDYSESFEPAKEATNENPLEFPVLLLEIEEALDENGCGEFYVVASLYQEIYDGDILIERISQSVSILWSENINASSRHGSGSSFSSGSQGGGSGSQGGGSNIDPASVILCLEACDTE
jgi:hypothetical protein